MARVPATPGLLRNAVAALAAMNALGEIAQAAKAVRAADGLPTWERELASSEREDDGVLLAAGT